MRHAGVLLRDSTWVFRTALCRMEPSTAHHQRQATGKGFREDLTAGRRNEQTAPSFIASHLSRCALKSGTTTCIPLPRYLPQFLLN